MKVNIVEYLNSWVKDYEALGDACNPDINENYSLLEGNYVSARIYSMPFGKKYSYMVWDITNRHAYEQGEEDSFETCKLLATIAYLRSRGLTWRSND